MRKAVIAALLAAGPLAALTPAPAAAYCDPKYYPLCTNDCRMRPPNPKDPLEYFRRVCPD